MISFVYSVEYGMCAQEFKVCFNGGWIMKLGWMDDEYKRLIDSKWQSDVALNDCDKRLRSGFNL